MTVYVLPQREVRDFTGEIFNVTSRGKDSFRALSPFFLGPVPVSRGRWESKNVENAWQFSKVYPQHWDDANRMPTPEWRSWAEEGWSSSWAHRYPMGRGARPVCSWWDGERLDYIQARSKIYIPTYRGAVIRHQRNLFDRLKERSELGDIAIVDFDAYNHHDLGYSWDDVKNDPSRKMGHGFVLAMMIEGHV